MKKPHSTLRNNYFLKIHVCAINLEEENRDYMERKTNNLPIASIMKGVFSDLYAIAP